MITYPDGTIIKTGDHIWWNEGACIGFVQGIILNYEQHETQSPLILVGNHPFDPEKSGYMQIEVDDFFDEGVGLLSQFEESKFDLAYKKALLELPAGFKVSEFAVETQSSKGKLLKWEFYFKKDEEWMLVSIPA